MFQSSHRYGTAVLFVLAILSFLLLLPLANGSAAWGDTINITKCDSSGDTGDFASIGDTHSLGDTFVLQGNIGCGGEDIDPIGQVNTDTFTGIFDGQGNVISNVSISDRNGQADTHLALFGANDGVIRDLTVDGISVDGSGQTTTDRRTGGLVALNAGRIDTAQVVIGANDRIQGSSAGVSGEDDGVGGLVGQNRSGTVAWSSVRVENDSGIYTDEAVALGGLIGINESLVKESYVKGEGTIAGGERMGGLVGYNLDADASIENVFSAVDVDTAASGSSNVGGLIGFANNSTVNNSFAVGFVADRGSYTTGGFVGANSVSTFTDNYWDTRVSSQTGGQPGGVTALNTAEMIGSEAASNMVLDFSGTWRSVEGAYPILSFEVDNEAVEPPRVNITQPVDGLDTSSTTLDVTGTTNRADAGDTVTLLVDGANTEAVPVQNNADSSWIVNNLTLDTGPHTILARLHKGDSEAPAVALDQSEIRIHNTSLDTVEDTGGNELNDGDATPGDTVLIQGRSDGSAAGDTVQVLVENADRTNSQSFYTEVVGEGANDTYQAEVPLPFAGDTNVLSASALAEGPGSSIVDSSDTFEVFRTTSTNEHTLQVCGDGGGDTDFTQIGTGSLNMGDTYYLGNDIDCNGESLEPVGATESDSFTGTFVGNGFEIQNVEVIADTTHLGVFGLVSRSGTIREVTLNDPNVQENGSGVDQAGVLAGENQGRVVTVDVSISQDGVLGRGSGGATGGLVGRNAPSGTIIESQVTVDTPAEVEVSFTSGSVGGLVGVNEGIVRKSAALGSGIVTGSTGSGDNEQIGGLVGYLTNGKIVDSYSTLKVVSGATTDGAGGLVGDEFSSNGIRRSYATGEVIVGSGLSGGLVGGGSGSSVDLVSHQSYWDIRRTGQDTGVGEGDGEEVGRITTQMTGDQASAYMGELDFGDTWTLVNDAYPILDFQNASEATQPELPTVNITDPADNADTVSSNTFSVSGSITSDTLARAGDTVSLLVDVDTRGHAVVQSDSSWDFSNLSVDTGLKTIEARYYQGDTSVPLADTDSIDVRFHNLGIDSLEDATGDPLSDGDTTTGDTVLVRGRSGGSAAGDSVTVLVEPDGGPDDTVVTTVSGGAGDPYQATVDLALSDTNAITARVHAGDSSTRVVDSSSTIEIVQASGISIDRPADGTDTGQRTVAFGGTTTGAADGDSVSVLVDGVDTGAVAVLNDQWDSDVLLDTGPQELLARFHDGDSTAAIIDTDSVQVRRHNIDTNTITDTDGDALSDGDTTVGDTVLVEGRSDGSGAGDTVSVLVDPEGGPADSYVTEVTGSGANDTFSLAVDLAQRDTNVLSARVHEGDSSTRVVDSSGTFTVGQVSDIVVTIDTPVNGLDTGASSLDVRGTTERAQAGDSVTVLVDGDTVDTVASVRNDADSSWDLNNVELDTGSQTIEASLHDGDSTAEVTSTDMIQVRRHDIRADTFLDAAGDTLSDGDTTTGDTVLVQGRSDGSAEGDSVTVLADPVGGSPDTFVTEVTGTGAGDTFETTVGLVLNDTNVLSARVHEGDSTTPVVDATGTFSVGQVADAMIRIGSPADGHETDVRSVTVSGTTALADDGDSVGLSVNGGSISYTAVDGAGNWNFSSVTLGDSGNQVGAGILESGPGTDLEDTDAIQVVYDDTGPSVPDLVSPGDGADTGDTTVSFDWDPSSDTITSVKNYRIQLDTEPGFAAPLVEAGDTTATDTTFALDANDTYYWRVLARDTLDNTSGYSPPRSFRVDTRPPLVDTAALQVDDKADTLGLANLDGDSTLRDNIRHRVRISLDGADSATLYHTNNGDTAGTGDTPVNFIPGSGDSWVAEIPSANFEQGDTVNFIVETSDAAGNTTVADSQGNGFRYEVQGEAPNDPPTVDLIFPDTDAVVDGDVTGEFNISDPQDDTGTIVVEYVAVAGDTIDSATIASGDTTPVSMSPGEGETHTFTWESATDFPDSAQVKLQLRATDGDSDSNYDTSGTFTVDNREAGIGIVSPPNGHDTNVQSITVGGMTAAASPGDSVAVSVDSADTVYGQTSSDSWTVSGVQLDTMGHTVRAVVYASDTESVLQDTNAITVNFDDVAGTYPGGFTLVDTGVDTVALDWNAFGSDRDTGVGFENYAIFYDTGVTPDASSTRWDSGGDPVLGNLSADSTVVSGLNADTEYRFRVGYVDRLGNVSRLSNDVAGTPSVTGAANLQLIGFSNTTETAPARAGIDDTVTVNVTWENTGGAPATVDVDTDPSDITVRDVSGNEVSGFERDFAGTPPVSVPAGDTALLQWKIGVSSDTELLGNFQLQYDTFVNRRIPLNIADVANTNSGSISGIDSWTARLRGLELMAGGGAGTTDDEASHDPGEVPDGSNIIVTLQQGDTETIDTPLVDPAYEFHEPGNNYRDAVEAANDEVVGVDEDTRLVGSLVNLGVWKDEVDTDNANQYVGNDGVLREEVRVSMPNPVPSDSKVVVVKLTKDDYRWRTLDATPSIEDGRLEFEVSPEGDLGGFSVFRLITVQVSPTGKGSETVVYPNPFIPYDGNDETGRYGTDEGDGISFAAGPNEGFPAGTHLAIYTVTGDRVFETTTTTGGIIQWDARTLNGEPVASGVYVYRLNTPDGSEKVGKLSIVR